MKPNAAITIVKITTALNGIKKIKPRKYQIISAVKKAVIALIKKRVNLPPK